jgi:formamidopyrimidine-DNA glycosylase
MTAGAEGYLLSLVRRIGSSGVICHFQVGDVDEHQRVVAGLGNIYVCEALFRARISPKRLAASVAGERAKRLVPAIKKVLEAAILAGGSSLRDYAKADGELGYFQHHFAVYDREGERCPAKDCRGKIKRIVQSGRSTYYCPSCQK